MDLLQKLLSTDLKQQKQVYIKRLDENVTVRGMFDDGEFEEIQERSTYYEGKGKNQKKKFDQKQAKYMTIAKCLVEPNLNDAEVLKSTKVDEPWQAVPKLFLPGEQELLETAIGECTGFVDDAVEEAKNS